MDDAMIAVMSKVEIRREGFADERRTLLSREAIQAAAVLPISRGLFPTAIGHFPHAQGHLVRRVEAIPEYILIYCVAGAGWLRMRGESWRVLADHAVLIPPGASHTYGTSKHRPWSIYWVHFVGCQADDYAEAVGFRPESPVFHVGKAGEMIYHFESMYSRVRHGGNPKLLVSMSTSLAHFLGELALQRQDAPTPAKAGLDAVQQTIAFMRQNLSRSLTVAELAGIAHLSVPHYYSRFKEITGYPPIAFFLRMKMEEASHLLHSSDHKVKEIAHLLGFEDPLYFSRQFRRVTGMAPTEYREGDGT
jgi:AraC family transcriptional regulator, arabinose operon regulatory protein